MKYTILMLFFALQTNASPEVYVDMISDGVKNTNVVITIGSCETTFKLPNNQVENLSNNNAALDQMVKLAQLRYNNKCEN